MFLTTPWLREGTPPRARFSRLLEKANPTKMRLILGRVLIRKCVIALVIGFQCSGTEILGPKSHRRKHFPVSPRPLLYPKKSHSTIYVTVLLAKASSAGRLNWELTAKPPGTQENDVSQSLAAWFPGTAGPLCCRERQHVRVRCWCTRGVCTRV